MTPLQLCALFRVQSATLRVCVCALVHADDGTGLTAERGQGDSEQPHSSQPSDSASSSQPSAAELSSDADSQASGDSHGSSGRGNSHSSSGSAAATSDTSSSSSSSSSSAGESDSDADPDVQVTNTLAAATITQAEQPVKQQPTGNAAAGGGLAGAAPSGPVGTSLPAAAATAVVLPQAISGAAAAPAASAPLPPPGSYYEYAGQRVLVPAWPVIKLRSSKAVSSSLSAVLKQAWNEDAPPGERALALKGSSRGLTDWGKEMLLRMKARVAALETTEPAKYAEVRIGTAHKAHKGFGGCHGLLVYDICKTMLRAVLYL